MRTSTSPARNAGGADALRIHRPRGRTARAPLASSDGRSTNGVSVRLESPLLAVELGGCRVLTARVSNRTELVDNFRIEVLGPAADWSTITPEAVGLLPGEEVDVTVTVSPPRQELSGPEIPFALKITSEVPPNDSGVERGVLRVLDRVPSRTAGDRRWRRTAVAVAAAGARMLDRR